MAAKTAPLQILRRTTLGVILVGLTILTILHQRVQGIPTIDSLDPFGGLETLLKWVAGGEIIKKLAPGTVVLFGGIVALGIVLSRFFCGWFCAFGALQGIFGWLGKKIFRKRFTVPVKLDAILRWVKYPLLVLIIWFTWTTGTLVIRPYDPLAAYGHLSAGLEAVWGEFAVGLVILVGTLLLSMLHERAFCKYLCPLGAINAILGRIPLLRIKRVASTCISCSKCDKVCPMNIDVSHPDRVGSAECISCMECVTACPTGKGMLSFAQPGLPQAASAGKLKVEDIKGSDTWEMVAEYFGVELERLYRESGVDARSVPPATMLKDTGKVGGITGFEADTVRVAVAKILGMPYASEIVKAAPPIPATTPAPASPAAPVAVPTNKSASGALVVPDAFALEGTMTIMDVAVALKCDAVAVVAKLGLPADIAVDKPLRDMKDRYGYTMPELKAKLKE